MLRCFSYICMIDNTILRTMKKTVMLFIACICFTHLSYAQTVELPEWVLNPKEGEFIGISLPGGDQREAECMALYKIALFIETCVNTYSDPVTFSYSESYGSDNSRSEVSTEVMKRVCNQSISYNVKRVERLPTEEIVVLLSAGNDKHDGQYGREKSHPSASGTVPESCFQGSCRTASRTFPAQGTVDSRYFASFCGSDVNMIRTYPCTQAT